MRRITAIFIAVLAVGLVACGGGATTVNSAKVVTLELTEFKYSTPAIEVPADQKVTLELKNKGAVEHDFAIDAIGFKAIVKPGQSATRVLGPFAAGATYEVYCSVIGHKEAGMVGTLVVK